MAAPRPYGLRSLGHSAAPFTFHPDPFGVQDAESDNNNTNLASARNHQLEPPHLEPCSEVHVESRVREEHGETAAILSNELPWLSDA